MLSVWYTHCTPYVRILIVLLWQNEPLLAHLHVTRCVCLRQQNVLRHHWVHRRRQEGKCRQCGKVRHAFIEELICNIPVCLCYLSLSLQSFPQKFFHSKEIVAISCSWCKQAVSVTSVFNSLGYLTQICFISLSLCPSVP